MSEENNKVCLFDLDGTLADYTGQLAEDFNRIKHPSEPTYSRESFGQDQKEPDWFYQRRSCITDKEEWWENLPKWQPGFDILEMAEEIGFRIMVLTQGPATKPAAWSGKIKWCQEHLAFLDVTITRDKNLVYGRVLVDDWPEYAEGWLKNRPRGLVIMPEHHWNKKFYHVNALHYSDNKVVVREALQKAFDR